MEESQKRGQPVIVSAAGDDIIVETIYGPETNRTAFVIGTGDTVSIASHWECAGVRYRPVSPGNNLLKHRALLFPSEPLEFGSEAELCGDIERYIARYVALPHADRALCRAYIVLSWLYDVFAELPYLRFRGDYGTGKSRALIVVGSICYKPFFASGASTVSPIFHTLDAFRGTLIFDEADFRFSDEKAELVKILNNGNMRGFPVLRTHVTPKQEFDPRAFNVFGPKIVGMRRSYEDKALESRFFTFEMEPGRADGMPINLPPAQAEEALVLRNKLLMYRLRNWHRAAIDPSLADASLEPRINQILVPLLSVVADAPTRTVLIDRARRHQIGIINERGDTPEAHILTVLRDKVQNRTQHPSIADIAASFAKRFGAEYERPATNRWVGSVLRRMGIALYKSNGVIVVAPGQTPKVRTLCQHYGIDWAVAIETGT